MKYSAVLLAKTNKETGTDYYKSSVCRFAAPSATGSFGCLLLGGGLCGCACRCFACQPVRRSGRSKTRTAAFRSRSSAVVSLRFSLAVRHRDNPRGKKLSRPLLHFRWHWFIAIGGAYRCPQLGGSVGGGCIGKSSFLRGGGVGLGSQISHDLSTENTAAVGLSVLGSNC